MSLPFRAPIERLWGAGGFLQTQSPVDDFHVFDRLQPEGVGGLREAHETVVSERSVSLRGRRPHTPAGF